MKPVAAYLRSLNPHLPRSVLTARAGGLGTRVVRREAARSPSASAATKLDLEDVVSKRQRPKIDEYPEYLFVVLHFPAYERSVQRPNAAEPTSSSGGTTS